MSERGSTASPDSIPSRLKSNPESFRVQPAKFHSFYSLLPRDGLKSEAIGTIFKKYTSASTFIKRIKHFYQVKILKRFPRKIYYLFHIVNILLQSFFIILMSIFLEWNIPLPTLIVGCTYVVFSFGIIILHGALSIVFIDRITVFLLELLLQSILVFIFIFQLLSIDLATEKVHYFNWIIGMRIFHSTISILNNNWLSSIFQFVRNPFTSNVIESANQVFSILVLTLSSLSIMYTVSMNTLPSIIEKRCATLSGEQAITFAPYFCDTNADCSGDLICATYSADGKSSSFDDPLQGMFSVILLVLPHSPWKEFLKQISAPHGFLLPLFLLLLELVLFGLIVPSLWLGMCFWSVSKSTHFPTLSLNASTRERFQQMKQDSKKIRFLYQVWEMMNNTYNSLSFQVTEWCILLCFLILEVIFQAISELREWKFIVDSFCLAFSMIQLLFIPIIFGSKYRIWMISDHLLIFSTIIWMSINIRRVPLLLSFRISIKSLIIVTRLVKERLTHQFSRALHYIFITHLVFLPLLLFIVSSIGYDFFNTVNIESCESTFSIGFSSHLHSFISTYIIFMAGDWVSSLRSILNISSIPIPNKVLSIVFFIVSVSIFHIILRPHIQSTIIASFSKIHSYRDIRYEESALVKILQTIIRRIKYIRRKIINWQKSGTKSSKTLSVFPESTPLERFDQTKHNVLDEIDTELYFQAGIINPTLKDQDNNQRKKQQVRVTFCGFLQSLRYFFRNIISSRLYKFIYMIAILAFVITFFFEAPSEAEYGKRHRLLHEILIDTIAFSIFGFDIAIRILQLNPIWKDPLLLLDGILQLELLFSCLIFVVKIPLENMIHFQLLSLIRVLRVLKPIRLCTEFYAIRRYARALLKSLISLFVYIIVLASFLFSFAIVGNAIFMNGKMRCSDSTITDVSLCVGIFKNEMGIYTHRYIPKSLFYSIPSSFITLIELISIFHFKEIISSVFSSNSAMKIGWMTFLEAFYFIIFSLFICLFLLFIPLAIIFFHIQEDKFGRAWAPEKSEWSYLKQWAMLQSPIPYSKVPTNSFRKILYYLTSSTFSKCVFALILSFTGIIMNLQFSGQPYWLFITPKALAVLIVLVNLIETMLHVMANGIESHVRDPLRKLGYYLFLLAIISPIMYFVSNSWTNCYMLLSFVGITFVILRVLDCLRQFRHLNMLIELLHNLAPSLICMLFIFFWLVLGLAMMGVKLFGQVKFQTGINWQANFRSVPHALLIFNRISVGGNWRAISRNASIGGFFCTRNDEFNDCGSTFWSYLLASVAFILIPIIWTNLFSSIVLDHYALYYSPVEILHVNRSTILTFISAWSLIDPFADGFAPLYMLEDLNKILLKEKCHTIAFHSLDRKEVKKMNLIICELHLFQKKRKVYEKHILTDYNQTLPFSIEWMYTKTTKLFQLIKDVVDRIVKMGSNPPSQTENSILELDDDDEDIMSFWYCLQLMLYHRIPNNSMLPSEFKTRSQIMELVEREYSATYLQKWWRYVLKKRKRQQKPHRDKNKLLRGHSISSMNSQRDFLKMKDISSNSDYLDHIETVTVDDISQEHHEDSNLKEDTLRSHSSYKMSATSSEVSLYSEEPPLISGDTFTPRNPFSTSKSKCADNSPGVLQNSKNDKLMTVNVNSDSKPDSQNDPTWKLNIQPSKTTSSKSRSQNKTKNLIFNIFSHLGKKKTFQVTPSSSTGESNPTKSHLDSEETPSTIELVKDENLVGDDYRMLSPELRPLMNLPGMSAKLHKVEYSRNNIPSNSEIPILTITDANSSTETWSPFHDEIENHFQLSRNHSRKSIHKNHIHPKKRRIESPSPKDLFKENSDHLQDVNPSSSSHELTLSNPISKTNPIITSSMDDTSNLTFGHYELLEMQRQKHLRTFYSSINTPPNLTSPFVPVQTKNDDIDIVTAKSEIQPTALTSSTQDMASNNVSDNVLKHVSDKVVAGEYTGKKLHLIRNTKKNSIEHELQSNFDNNLKVKLGEDNDLLDDSTQKPKDSPLVTEEPIHIANLNIPLRAKGQAPKHAPSKTKKTIKKGRKMIKPKGKKKRRKLKKK